MRTVRSYVRREGRITAAQRGALESLARRYCLADTPAVADLDAVFGRRAPRIVEIGCGAGEVLAGLAARHPENDYLGIEVYRPGIGRLLRELDRGALANVRVAVADAAELFARRLAPASLTAVLIFFPDPWPKKRHHKRRLIQPAFLEQVRDALAGHGRLYLATDWPDYAAYMLAAAAAVPGLVNLGICADYAPRPRWRPTTRFEARALAAGRRIHELLYARR